MEESSKLAVAIEHSAEAALPLRIGHARRRTPKLARLARILFDPRLIAWNLLVLALGPALLTMKLRRYLKKRTNHEFNVRRLFLPPVQPADASDAGGPRVVFVGASFGEVLLIERVSRALLAQRPDLAITWSVRDPRTIEEIIRHKPQQRVAVWPFDNILSVLQWLWKNDPELIVLTERYSFPNFVVASRLWGARVALVNGRAKASKVLAPIRPYYRWLFGCFDSFGFQSETYANRVRDLLPAAARVSVTGNIKLDLARKELDPKRARQVDAWLAADPSTPILAAGSTNNKEEERFVLEAFALARNRRPCRLLLAPRKFERVPEAVRLAQERGLTVSYRTRVEPPADVMVLDTLGELAHAYQHCVAAYVGGAYNGMGHNVAEPVEWGIPVSYGLRRGHFEELQKMCERAGVGFRVANEQELAEHWSRVLDDESFRLDVRRAAAGMFANERGAVDRTAQSLLQIIEAI